MKLCLKCNLWLTLKDYDLSAATRGGRWRCNSKSGFCRTKKPHLPSDFSPTPLVQVRVPHRGPKKIPDGLTQKFEQALARVETGDSPKFAAERCGIDPDWFLAQLEELAGREAVRRA